MTFEKGALWALEMPWGQEQPAIRCLSRAQHVTAMSVRMQDNDCDRPDDYPFDDPDDDPYNTHDDFDYWPAVHTLPALHLPANLQSLELWECGLMGRTLAQLGRMLACTGRLTSLVLEGCEGHIKCGTVDGVAAFARNLAVQTALVRLRLLQVTVEDAGASELGTVLAGLPQLRVIDLYKCYGACPDTYEHFAPEVAQGLAACASLVTLKLSDCGVRGRSSSLRHLCRARASLQSLTLDEKSVG